MTEKRTIDWERIELDYLAGILSLREIASPHDVTEASVRKRAKRDGWTRDLSAKIKAKADLRPVTLQDPMSKSGFVYVIYLDDSAGERFYKIGMSDSFSSRFSGHQCSSPFLICVACAYFTGSMRF